MIIRYIRAWIKKYIFHIKSPSAKWLGYDYEWDYMREVNADEEN